MCSPFADNYLIVHFSPGAGKTDILQSVRHKTELLGLLSVHYKQKTGQQLNVRFLNR